MPRAGDACPEFSIAAAVSGRTISPPTLKGHRLVLVFHGVKNSEVAKEVGKAVRAKWTSAAEVTVANVVDLRSMAGLWKRVAEAQIKATYEKMAGRITAGDAADYVIICPDWENKVAPLFDVFDPGTEAGVAVIGADGRIVGIVKGSDLGSQTVALLT